MKQIHNKSQYIKVDQRKAILSIEASCYLHFVGMICQPNSQTPMSINKPSKRTIRRRTGKTDKKFVYTDTIKARDCPVLHSRHGCPMLKHKSVMARGTSVVRNNIPHCLKKLIKELLDR